MNASAAIAEAVLTLTQFVVNAVAIPDALARWNIPITMILSIAALIANGLISSANCAIRALPNGGSTLMPETLPGDPTEAGPDTRVAAVRNWEDEMEDAEEESRFARHRHRATTPEGRRQLLEAICRAEEFFAAAKESLR